MAVPSVTLKAGALVGVAPQMMTVMELASLPVEVRLGCILKPQEEVPRFAAYFSPEKMTLPPPASINRRDKAARSLARMYLNDKYGCHSADTEVLTEHGWVGWPDYDGQSLLGTMNQETGFLEFQAPEACVRYDYDGPMAFAAHKGLDFALTPDHRMFYRQYKIPCPYVAGSAGYGPFQFGTVDSLPTRCLLPGATTGFIGTELRTLRIGDRIWDGTDFLRLLAIVLSCGWTGGAPTTWERVSFSCFREDRRPMMADLALRLGLPETVRQGVWEWRDPGLAEWLRANAYTGSEYRSPFKRIPDLVKIADQEQIEEFLNFFGDQHTAPGHGREFYSTSRRIMDDLQELLLRTGKRATLHDGIMKPGTFASDGRWFEQKHPLFTLREWQDSDIVLQRLKRCPTVEFDHYKGEVFCATVPNSTLVTRRNGRLLVSGNCCVIAGKSHCLGLWSANDADSGGEVQATDNEIYQQYQSVCGPGDNGCVISNVLDYMKVSGFKAGGKRYAIDGYVAVDWTDKLQTQTVQYVFGAGAIGIHLPEEWTTAAVWDVTDSQIVGGHDVAPIDYDEQGVYVASWGRVYLITWQAWLSRRWLSEYWAILAPLWYGSDKLAPSGIDAAALRADMVILGRGDTPPMPDGPTPPPTPTPTPPPQKLFSLTFNRDVPKGGVVGSFRTPVRIPKGSYDLVPSRPEAVVEFTPEPSSLEESPDISV